MLIRNIFSLLISFIFIGLLGGCAFSVNEGKPIDPANRKVSMVFGYIDMEDAPSGLGWVQLKRYKPKPAHEYYAGVEEGIFWHVGIETGSYQVERFGKEPGFFGTTRYSYNFGGSGRNQTARRIKKPGLYYLGSYKYKEKPGKKWYLPDKFEMLKLRSPSEEVILQKLLKFMQESDDLKIYKRQIGWMKARLKKLK